MSRAAQDGTEGIAPVNPNGQGSNHISSADLLWSCLQSLFNVIDDASGSFPPIDPSLLLGPGLVLQTLSETRLLPRVLDVTGARTGFLLAP